MAGYAANQEELSRVGVLSADRKRVSKNDLSPYQVTILGPNAFTVLCLCQWVISNWFRGTRNIPGSIWWVGLGCNGHRNKTALFFQALAERCRRIDPAALIAL
jgi:hypothetical protein